MLPVTLAKNKKEKNKVAWYKIICHKDLAEIFPPFLMEQKMTYQTNAFAHGIGNSVVASNWANRPADEKFLSLDDMLSYKIRSRDESEQEIVNTHDIEVYGQIDEQNPQQGDLVLEYNGQQVNPTNWSFNQIASLAGAPAGYLRDLPAPIAADAIQWGLRHNRSKELIKTLKQGDRLRAATGPDYGRIFDMEVLQPVMDLVDRSGGRWKIPGMITGQKNGFAVYDPHVPVSMETTTLFASDRDIFIFLVDDLNPIEIGKLPNGDPDLMFRGFYAWNSETGSKTAGIASMYLRGVCMNRNLWGVENFEEIKIRHTKFAGDRFTHEARPALQSFAHGSSGSLVQGVREAQNAKIASDKDEAISFLNRRAGLSMRMAKAAYSRHDQEEQKPLRTVWDAAQAITSIARDIPHQDNRVDMEKKAGALLDKVVA